ncbi:MAG: hypothetical protein CMB56_007630 [Methanobacteriota archaeon]|nr:MAG: hypothetical protein CMB56_007630 [Euryarchaeota archaeon]
MFLEALFTVLTLLIIGLVTPGPNNITCITHSAVHGNNSNYNLIFGMATGFVTVHFIVGLLVSSLDENSIIFDVLHYFGLLFIFLLSLRIFTLNPSQINTKIETHSVFELMNKEVKNIPILGFKTGLLMQFINGKEWAFVFTIMWLALEGFGGGWLGIILITTITTTGGVIAMFTWTFIGGRLVNIVSDQKRGKSVFMTLGALLFALGFLLLIRGPQLL